MGASFGGLLILAAMLTANGNVATDLLSLMDAEDYLSSRQVALKPADLARVAGEVPRDAKAEVIQLLAIRWLGEHAGEVKEVARVREVLRDVADGKRGRDELGFAPEYAAWALARVDGRPARLSSRAMAKDSVRGEGLAWFPAETKFVACVDFRPSRAVAVPEEEFICRWFAKLLPGAGREELYKFVERVGNLRLDRFAVGRVEDVREKGSGRTFFRLTGKGNHERVAELFGPLMVNGQRKDEKGAGGAALTYLRVPGRPPAIVLIGDSEILFAAFDDSRDSLDLVKESLQTRSGAKPSVLTGPLARRWQEVPSGASILVAGTLPAEVREEFGRRGPLPGLPQEALLYVAHGKRTTLRTRCKAASADDAKTFADGVAQIKAVAVKALEDLPAGIKIRPDTLRKLRQAVEDFRVDAQGQAVTGDWEVPADLFRVVQQLVRDWAQTQLPQEFGGPPPPAKRNPGG